MEYTLYDDGKNPDSKEAGPLRRELLHVNFINSLRNRNPGAMEVIVPNVDNNGNCVAVQPDEANPEGLKDKLAAGKLANTMVFKNREPKWNKESNMYQLDFQGRAVRRRRRPTPPSTPPSTGPPLATRPVHSTTPRSCATACARTVPPRVSRRPHPWVMRQPLRRALP
eukprot:6126123-Prymnesium_polylepis.2